MNTVEKAEGKASTHKEKFAEKEKKIAMKAKEKAEHKKLNETKKAQKKERDEMKKKEEKEKNEKKRQESEAKKIRQKAGKIVGEKLFDESWFAVPGKFRMVMIRKVQGGLQEHRRFPGLDGKDYRGEQADI
jgi:preprotein translocase subunit SecF